MLGYEMKRPNSTSPQKVLQDTFRELSPVALAAGPLLPRVSAVRHLEPRNVDHTICFRGLNRPFESVIDKRHRRLLSQLSRREGPLIFLGLGVYQNNHDDCRRP